MRLCVFGVAACVLMPGWGCAGHREATSSVAAGGVADTGSVGQGKAPKVVLKPIHASGVSADEAAGVEGKFCVEISKIKRVDLMCSDDLKALIEHEQDLVSFGTCDEDVCLAKLGEAIHADFLVQAWISRVGEALVFRANLIEAKSGSVKNRFSEEVKSGKTEDLLDSVSRVAARMGGEF